MATLRQIEANRRNAAKSTGPVTESGKERSRRNALVHGLAGEGIVLDDRDAAIVAERLETWRAGYELKTAEDEWLFEQLVIHAVRVDACRARESALRSYEATRAARVWDEDRRAETEEIASRLSRHPGRTLTKLETTAAGCRWLIQRWAYLAESGSADWTEAQRSLAFDLMGVPSDARQGDPWSGYDSPRALAEAEGARLSARLDDGLDDLDAAERTLAAEGTPVRHSPEIERLRRYEAACLRRYEQARARLTRREPSPAVPEPEPIPDPVPSTPPASGPARRVEPRCPSPIAAAPEMIEPLPPRPSQPAGLNRRARRAARRQARSGLR